MAIERLDWHEHEGTYPHPEGDLVRYDDHRAEVKRLQHLNEAHTVMMTDIDTTHAVMLDRAYQLLVSTLATGYVEEIAEFLEEYEQLHPNLSLRVKS